MPRWGESYRLEIVRGCGSLIPQLLKRPDGFIRTFALVLHSRFRLDPG
jgi:hypothetical protein